MARLNFFQRHAPTHYILHRLAVVAAHIRDNSALNRLRYHRGAPKYPYAPETTRFLEQFAPSLLHYTIAQETLVAGQIRYTFPMVLPSGLAVHSVRCGSPLRVNTNLKSLPNYH